MNARIIAIAALGAAGVLATAAAQAHGRDDVQFSITIGSPAWVRPAPVYAPAPIARFDERFHERSDYRRRPTRWDVDGDGIPNRFDRHDDRRDSRDRHDDRDSRGHSRW